MGEPWPYTGLAVVADGKRVWTDRDLRQWEWSLPDWYQGFSPQELVRAWQIAWWLVQHRIIRGPRESTCTVCGSVGSNVLHIEHAYFPWNAMVVCRQCRSALLGRFADPDGFLAWALPYVKRHASAEWLYRVEPGKHDLAAEELEFSGHGIREFPELREWAGDRFPWSQLERLPSRREIARRKRDEWA